MVSYTCETCYKEFFKKYNYERHLNRKNPCKKNQKLKKYSTSKEKPSIIFQKIPDIFQENQEGTYLKTIEIVENRKEKREEHIKNGRHFLCDYCDRGYKQKYNLNKHLKKCKIKDQEIEVKEIIKDNDQEKEQMEKELNELKHKMEILLKYQIEGGNQNITNNTTNNNTNCNNTTLNITVNDYGKEDMNFLENGSGYKRILQHILSSGMQGLQQYIKYKYCNPEQPENMTIKYTNARSNKLQIRKDNSWVHRNKNEVIEELYDRDNNIEEVLSVYEKLQDMDNEPELDKIQGKFLSEIEEFYDNDLLSLESKKTMKDLKGKTLNDFYNCYKTNKIKFEENLPNNF